MESDSNVSRRFTSIYAEEVHYTVCKIHEVLDKLASCQDVLDIYIKKKGANSVLRVKTHQKERGELRVQFNVYMGFLSYVGKADPKTQKQISELQKEYCNIMYSIFHLPPIDT
jgi:hypothetical protein